MMMLLPLVLTRRCEPLSAPRITISPAPETVDAGQATSPTRASAQILCFIERPSSLTDPPSDTALVPARGNQEITARARAQPPPPTPFGSPVAGREQQGACPLRRLNRVERRRPAR